MAPVLTVEDLRLSYRGDWLVARTHALRGVSFDVQAGETLGLLGPNGAGKTSTFKCVTGLVRPRGGRVRLFGLDPRDPRARERLGFLPENPYFYDFLTAEELVSLAARLSGLGAAERRRRVPEVLDLVGLGDARRRRLRTYSKGMTQRVGIAQAIVARPSLVILDEPLTGLDPRGRRDVRDLIGRLAGDDTAVVFSTHVLQDVELTCDRVLMLAGGRVLRQGRLEELLSDVEAPVELVVEGLGPRQADELARDADIPRVGAGGGQLAFRAPDSASAEALRARLAAAGGRVVAVSPQPVTLEDVFLRELAESREPAP